MNVDMFMLETNAINMYQVLRLTLKTNQAKRLPA